MTETRNQSPQDSFSQETSTFHPSLNCNSFPVFPFLFQKIIKDFHCCLTVPCGKFKAVVHEIFNRIQFEVLQVVVKPLVCEIVHAKPPSLNASQTSRGLFSTSGPENFNGICDFLLHFELSFKTSLRRPWKCSFFREVLQFPARISCSHTLS